MENVAQQISHIAFTAVRHSIRMFTAPLGTDQFDRITPSQILETEHTGNSKNLNTQVDYGRDETGVIEITIIRLEVPKRNELVTTEEFCTR